MFEKFAISTLLLTITLMALSSIDLAHCQGGIFMKNEAGDLQRIDKRSRPQNGNNNDDFEKFFLKASKSVPRIGRRRIEEQQNEMKLPLWAELSDLYEYNPELFASPQLLARWLEYYNSQLPREATKTSDDGPYGGWAAKMRFKRDQKDQNQSPDAELDEYRLQP